MKPSRENIYINLRGKSEEELTELYWLLKNNNETLFENRLNRFLEYTFYTIPFGYSKKYNNWCCGEFSNRTEVTIQQLKEILQPMENKEFDLKGYSVEVDNEVQAKQLQEMAFKQGVEWYNGKILQHLNEKFFNFSAFNGNKIHYGSMHFKDGYVTKEIHFKDIFKKELTLTEQLEKAEAEVKRLKEAIEDSNKIKFGDWVVNNGAIATYKKTLGIENSNETKIPDQDLINKLTELIK